MRARKKAQQLVEFVLILPVLLMVLVVIIETGFAINARITLSEAVKMSMAEVSQLAGQTGNETNKTNYIKNQLNTDLISYFNSHNIPYANTMNVKIGNVTGTNLALVSASYNYSPTFTLPNLLGAQIIPSKYSLRSQQLINKALISDNSNFNLSDDELRNKYIYPSTSILKTTNIDGINMRDKIGFLIDTDGNTRAELRKWDGTEFTATSGFQFDLTNGYLYQGNVNKFTPYVCKLFESGITTAIDTRMNSAAWCSTAAECTGDVSHHSYDLATKRALSFLMADTGKAWGSYEPIDDSMNNFNKVKSYVFKNGTKSILRLFMAATNANPGNCTNATSLSAGDSAEVTALNGYFK